MNNLPEIKVVRRGGGECFTHRARDLPMTLRDFWAWSSSDLVGNTLRGVLAEYVVASALEESGGVRVEWDNYDVLSREGIKVEVKSSAYIQSWKQKKFSSIQFDIKPTSGWDETNNTRSNVKVRQADVYVFCVLAHKAQESLNPLNLDQWDFYILATKSLNERLGNQETVSLSSLLALEPEKVSYDELVATIRKKAI